MSSRWLVLALVFLAAAAHSQTRYVSDRTIVELRRGPSTEYLILRNLEAGEAVLLIEANQLPTPARTAAALVPALGMAVFLWVEISYVRQLDELHRRVQLEALAVAFPLALLLVFTVGSLERAGVHIEGFERPRDLWPLVVIPYPIGLLFAWRRYR